MKTEELLQLQSALVSWLTGSGEFSEFPCGSARVWNTLSFLDPNLMELMRSLHRGKRLDKIRKILPRTMAYLNPEMDELTSEFMRCHPPLSADSYRNGCQFYSFLRRRWRVRLPNPPFLLDLAYCELAKVGLERRTTVEERGVLADASPIAQGAVMIRRRARVRLHQCQYDIQPLLDPGGHLGAVIHNRPVSMVFSQPLNSISGKIFGVDYTLFGLLKGLNSWTRVSVADDLGCSENTISFLRRLEELGFVEIRPCA